MHLVAYLLQVPTEQAIADVISFNNFNTNPGHGGNVLCVPESKSSKAVSGFCNQRYPKYNCDNSFSSGRGILELNKIALGYMLVVYLLR